MGENSKIEWCDHTFNPWIGCTKVSPACVNCYAETYTRRVGGPEWGKGKPRRRTTDANWGKPLAWNRKAEGAAVRPKVFCSSLADVFDAEVPAEWRKDLWSLIAMTPNLDWLLLTKRPENIARMLPGGWGDGWANVWLGTTVENQAEADRRIPHLLAVPAAVHFLSCEPMLGPVDLTYHLWGRATPCVDCPGDVDCGCGFFPRGAVPNEPSIGWVICGGESGPHARPMHPDWARSLRDQCAAAGVPFFFKQWGEWAPQIGAVDGWQIDDNPEISRFDHREWNVEKQAWGEPFWPAWCDWDGLEEEHVVSRIGKRRAGRLLDGKRWDQRP